MALGITFDEFWYGDFTRFKYIAEAKKLEKEARNEELWLGGYYVDYALATELANFGRGLSGKAGGKTRKYLEKPVDLFAPTEEEKEIEQEKETRNVIEYFDKLIYKQQKRKEGQNTYGNG